MAVGMIEGRLQALRRSSEFWSGLDPADRWLAALRGAALFGGAVWGTVHPLDHPFDHEAHRQVAWLFAIFAGYSVLLYVVNALSPGRLQLL